MYDPIRWVDIIMFEWWWCQMSWEVPCIYTICWGSRVISIGLHEPTWWCADLNNLHMCGHKFKNTLLLVEIGWSLYQFWSSWKEEFNAIIISIKWVTQRWNLALVSNFNTPSQLGRIPPADPSAIMYHLFHLCSAEPWCNNEEELIESESQDLNTLHWQNSVQR